MFKHYNAERYDPNASFEPVPPGPHRLRVEEAVQTFSRNGSAMIKVTFSVSGYTGRIFHYFVDNEHLQRNIDPFFDSFSVAPGDFDVSGWPGRQGAAHIKHEDYMGEPQAKIYRFLTKDKQVTLPSWGERGGDPSYAAPAKKDFGKGAYDTPYSGASMPECPF
jgi:hypothetical protein